MSRHRIVGCEADNPKPLAYLSMFPRRRRGIGRYLAAVLIGALLMLAVGVALATFTGLVSAT